jgi:2-oxoglutarate ferredoxin oxidoreductase subunit beta
MVQPLRQRYMRQSTPFCPGCGHGVFMNAFLHAADEVGLDFQNTVFVSGIGCGAWVPSPHFKADTLHVTHGRAVAFATGVKMARPDLDVIAIGGDGDIATIGGNHLIHAARRNVPIKVFCLNNLVYGMTGGQVSATTPQGDITSTTRQGNPEPAFDLAALALGAGARYVARFPVSQPRKLTKGIVNALRFEQFAFMDVLSLCPTQYGRANRARKGYEGPSLIWSMMEWQKRITVDRDKASGDDADGKILIGEWHEQD